MLIIRTIHWHTIHTGSMKLDLQTSEMLHRSKDSWGILNIIPHLLEFTTVPLAQVARDWLNTQLRQLQRYIGKRKQEGCVSPILTDLVMMRTSLHRRAQRPGKTRFLNFTEKFTCIVDTCFSHCPWPQAAKSSWYQTKKLLLLHKQAVGLIAWTSIITISKKKW